jgi:hypothetical protein
MTMKHTLQIDAQAVLIKLIQSEAAARIDKQEVYIYRSIYMYMHTYIYIYIYLYIHTYLFEICIDIWIYTHI